VSLFIKGFSHDSGASFLIDLNSFLESPETFSQAFKSVTLVSSLVLNPFFIFRKIAFQILKSFFNVSAFFVHINAKVIEAFVLC